MYVLYCISQLNFVCLGQRYNGHQEMSAMMNPFGFGGFGGGFGSGFDDMFSMANAGFASYGGSTGGNMKRTSISTRFANGKKITTKKYVIKFAIKHLNLYCLIYTLLLMNNYNKNVHVL